MNINPLPIILLILALITGIAAYVVEGLALFRMGKKASISWTWVAWIPGAENFVMALMNFAASVSMHQSFALNSVAPLPPVTSMHPVTVTSINSEPTTVVPSVLPVIMVVMSFIEGITILFAVFVMIQWGQVLERFGYSYAWLMWNFLPVVGTVVFFVILLRIAFRKEAQYQEAGVRTVFGSLVRERE